MPTYLSVGALVLAYTALVTAYLALRTLARLRRASVALSRGVRGRAGRESLLEAATRQAERSESLREEVAEVRAAVVALRTQLEERAADGAAAAADGLNNVALVRYDAFDGVSGRLSFSLALLDEAGDGVALSALAGPSDTRVYAKGVTAGRGTGEQPLSPEEQRAVAAARGKRRGLAARKAG